MLKFTSRFVNKASDWLIFVQGPIRGLMFTNLLVNLKFGMKYAIFREKLCEINCKIDVYDCQPQTADKKLKHELATYLSKLVELIFKFD